MNLTFDKLHSQLGRGTLGAFIAALGFFGFALFSALLGFTGAAESFRNCAAAMGIVFVVLLGVFLVTSIVAAVFRRLDRRTKSGNQTV